MRQSISTVRDTRFLLDRNGPTIIIRHPVIIDQFIDGRSSVHHSSRIRKADLRSLAEKSMHPCFPAAAAVDQSRDGTFCPSHLTHRIIFTPIQLRYLTADLVVSELVHDPYQLALAMTGDVVHLSFFAHGKFLLIYVVSFCETKYTMGKGTPQELVNCVIMLCCYVNHVLNVIRFHRCFFG